MTSFTVVAARTLCITFLSVVVFVSGNSLAGSTLSTTHCRSDIAGETRRLQVVYEQASSPVPCTVMYEKAGVESELGSARSTVGHCERIERQVIRNLSSVGWQCRHLLTGTEIEPDYSIQADRFSAGLAPLSTTNVRSRSALTALMQSQLDDIVHTEYLSVIQKQLQTDLQSRIESDHVVNVDLSIAVSVNDTYASLGEQNPAVSASEAASLAQLRRYVLFSESFSTENRSHSLAAQIRRSYPNLLTRVVSFGLAPDIMFRVVLGTSDSRDDLEKFLEAFDSSFRNVLQISDTENSQQPIRYSPDDWQRYLIAFCVSEGRTSTTELAGCSGFVLDADSLLDCLGGGSCVLKPAVRADTTTAISEIDLLEVLATDKPSVMARDRIIDEVRQCLALMEDNEHHDTIANCIAKRLLDNEQRFVFDCAQRNPSVSGLMECAAGAEVSQVVALYEQCAVSRKVNLQCLVEMTGSDHVARTSDCLQAGSNEKIRQCLTRADLDIGNQTAQSCLQDFPDAVQQIACISGGHLNAQQSAMLACSVNSPSAVDFGVCTAKMLQTGSSPAQLAAASCLVQGNQTALELLNCAGGRFAAQEIAACQATGTSWLSCFGARTLLSDILADTMG
ncbi:MAG: hypothetical protein AB8B63_20150, partial [Granulosicoccus sp.]